MSLNQNATVRTLEPVGRFVVPIVTHWFEPLKESAFEPTCPPIQVGSFWRTPWLALAEESSAAEPRASHSPSRWLVRLS